MEKRNTKAQYQNEVKKIQEAQQAKEAQNPQKKQKVREEKKYEELTITDDFMFGKVMQEPERCKKLLEIILGVKIRKLEFADGQYTINPDYNAKGIRMDIYLEDDGNTVYCVEMQASRKPCLPGRSRYYQSVIDINLLEKGDDYTKELDMAVEAARKHEEWRREFMKWYLDRVDAREEGREEGETKKLLELLCRKMRKGKCPEIIAEELEEPLEDIQSLYDTACQFAPDFDVDEIYEGLTKIYLSHS